MQHLPSMIEAKPIFIADSCVGGLSVLKSMRASGANQDVVFLADYAVNPLGIKSDEAIREVVFQWLGKADEVADTLVIGCNTLSIRYDQLLRTTRFDTGPAQVISMVDCFKYMVAKENERLSGKRVLIIGTVFTASQTTYPEILRAQCPSIEVTTIAATELERAIARLQPWTPDDDSVLTGPLRASLALTDVAILACTCFPMARLELERQFPEVVFLDPGACCAALLSDHSATRQGRLELQVTGDAVSHDRVVEFAETYLQSR
ncbi:MAG: aspartate/glutamate racemase family protein [Verrucomicrobia bacterium]|nr:aspartate/glutamate racemase family protein [Verrucomicrobiota bacterium]